MCQELHWGVIQAVSFDFDSKLMRWIFKQTLKEINGEAGLQT